MRHFRKQHESKIYIDHNNDLVELDTNRKYYKVSSLKGQASVTHISGTLDDNFRIRFTLGNNQYETTNVSNICKDLDSYYLYLGVEFDIDIQNRELICNLLQEGVRDANNSEWIYIIK